MKGAIADQLLLSGSERVGIEVVDCLFHFVLDEIRLAFIKSCMAARAVFFENPFFDRLLAINLFFYNALNSASKSSAY